MSEAKIAGKQPVEVQLEAGKTYAWCSCGLSGNQPFCDGSHAGTGMTPKVIKAEKDGAAWFCLCKQTENPPYCDGAHSQLEEENPHTVPHVAGREPVEVQLEAGKSYAWCSCGLSGNQPFCDGSHEGTGMTPKVVKAEKDESAWYCLCKQTQNPPYCDGTHSLLAEEKHDDETVKRWYRVADEGELKGGEVRAITAGGKSLVLTLQEGELSALDGKCPHQGGPLAEGTLEDGVLRCPWHGWGFCSKTGESTEESHGGVATYEVEVRDGGIHVAVESPPKPRTISDVMVETMVNWGVTHVFGMVGHSNLGLAEAIRQQEEKGNLTYIGIRHEGAASFACSAFGKLTGRPAACLTIAGPGATNLLTGLWDAHVDRSPVLALTGQVNTQYLGPGAFQEIDQVSAFEAVSAWSQTVLHSSNHVELMNLAVKHAVVERGVSHLIFPDEVQVLPDEGSSAVGGPDGRLGDVHIAPAPRSLERAVEHLEKAKHPTIIVGHGARQSMPHVIALAEKIGAPILTTFKAKGLISDHHPLAGGVLGRSGTPIASWFMNGSDLLLVFGASFADHTGIDRAKPIVQVDFDRLTLAKFHSVTVPVWGEIGITAQEILERLPARDSKTVKQEVAEKWQNWRAEKERRMQQDRGKGLNSAVVFDALSRVAPSDAVVAVDVGNNTYSFGRYFECKQQSVLMSGYLGSIGFGLPAAMGAWAAAPEKAILCVSGDGGFGQYLAEFTTAVKYGMNITHILLNNNELGKISKEQRAGEWEVWQTGLQNPNFAEFAQLCGGMGCRVTNGSHLESAIQEALAFEGPALVEVMTDAELI
jgi:thiamine pyrophosphate-dependent acetolactate synthase large subunit-like protein/CDGSH-type Zn-finger protein